MGASLLALAKSIYYNILQRKLTSRAQRDTALQKNITLTD